VNKPYNRFKARQTGLSEAIRVVSCFGNNPGANPETGLLGLSWTSIGPLFPKSWEELRKAKS
jgi:hypothetical protein